MCYSSTVMCIKMEANMRVKFKYRCMSGADPGFAKPGRTMVTAECEPVTGVWAAEPPAVQEQSITRAPETKLPEAESLVSIFI